MSPRHGGSPGAIPGSRTSSLQAARQHAVESPKLSLLRAARRQPAIFMGSWQTSNALALQAGLCGSVTHRLHQSQLRKTRPKYRERPHKLFQVGVTPTPATTVCTGHQREVIRLPDGKSRRQKTKSEGTNWSVTSTSHHFGLVAQSAERPVVRGRVEGATPFGSAIFSERSSIFRASGVGPGGAGGNPAVPTISNAAVAEYTRHPSSKRKDAGGNPAGSAIARWCQSSTAAC